MARKARKTPLRGSLMLKFDDTGRLTTFEIKGAAADKFFQAILKAFEKKAGQEQAQELQGAVEKKT